MTGGRSFTWVLFVCQAASFAYVGRWHSYTSMSHVTALAAHGNFLYVGTTGGIRRVNPADFSEKAYTNLDGLLDVGIAGLAVTPDGQLWAGSRGGHLYRLEGELWQDHGRRYAAEGWNIHPQAMLAAGRYVLLGGDRGLSFFDAHALRAEVNVHRFGELGEQPVRSLLIRGDSLFVGTPEGAVKAAVDLGNVLSDRFTSVFDPQIWTRADALQVDGAGGGPDREGGADYPEEGETEGDSLADADGTGPYFEHLFFRDGRLYATDLGVTLEEPFFVRAVRGLPLLAGQNEFKEPGFDRLRTAAVSGGRLFLGAPFGLFVFVNLNGINLENFVHLPSKSAFPATDTIGNVAARGGQVMALGRWSLYGFDGGQWPIWKNEEVAFPFLDLFPRNLKLLAIDDDADVYLGSWGFGLARFRGGRETRVWNSGNSCLDSVPGHGKFTVISAVSPARKDHVWLGNYKTELADAHHLALLNTRTEELHCFEDAGRDGHVHSIRILSDTLFAEATRGKGVFVFAFDPDYPANPPRLVRNIESDGLEHNASDMARDNYQRLWFFMNERLSYVDSVESLEGRDSVEVHHFDAFGGLACRTMDTDAAGGLWLGCGNGLFHVRPSPSGQKHGLERYTIDDGLLSNTVLHLALDRATGEVWVATDKGVSLFEGPGRPPRPDLKAAKVYPNPFRAKHDFVIFDELAQGSTLRIMTQSGYVVRHYSAREMLGNQFRWDGRNQAGRPVKPGVYLYSIDAGRHTRHGKLIVAH